jgi:DNA adenine methylase
MNSLPIIFPKRIGHGRRESGKFLKMVSILDAVFSRDLPQAGRNHPQSLLAFRTPNNTGISNTFFLSVIRQTGLSRLFEIARFAVRRSATSQQPNLMTMSVKHPVLKYYGSKFRLAKWIIEHFPKHRHYVEPFGGSASVLLVKEPSQLETYNDLNGLLVNFFRVLRDRPAELIHKINLTPWSRAEYEFCLFEPTIDDAVEMARRLYFRLWMCFQASMSCARGNFRRHKNGTRPLAKDIKIEDLIEASKRLKYVQFESRNAFQLIKEFDSPDTLFYLDPPYLFETRTSTNAYSHEMTDDDHLAFADTLYQTKGPIILSGYPSKLYADLFEAKGWKKVEKEAPTNAGVKRTECLWLSPTTQARLS